MSLTSCLPQECCDSPPNSDIRPIFYYSDLNGADLLNPEQPYGYDWDSVGMTLIQFNIAYYIEPLISGKYNLEAGYVGPIRYNFIEIRSLPATYSIAQTTETLLIYLNNKETDTIIYETYFPDKKDPTYVYWRNLTVNGVPHESNEGFVNIIKSR